MRNDQSPAKEVYRAPAFADFKSELSAPGATPESLAHLKEHGFVIINDFVNNPWDFNPSRGQADGLHKRARQKAAMTSSTAQRDMSTAQVRMNLGQSEA